MTERRIVAAVDDLMMASRIRSAAAGGPSSVTIVRSADDLIDQARSGAALLLLDLNATRLDPIATIGRVKSDPSLAGIRLIGFVSHVQKDVVAAARAAGIDEVLARSAFVARLPEILGA